MRKSAEYNNCFDDLIVQIFFYFFLLFLLSIASRVFVNSVDIFEGIR